MSILYPVITFLSQSQVFLLKTAILYNITIHDTDFFFILANIKEEYDRLSQSVSTMGLL